MSFACRILLVALIAVSCSSTPTTRYQHLRKVTLDSIGATMALPALYQEYSLDDELEYWDNSNLPDELKEKKINYLLSLGTEDVASHFLADSLDWTNNIRITENRFPVKIGKYEQQHGFLIMDSFVQQEADLLGVKMTALENTYFSLANGNDVMKVRYKVVSQNINTASFIGSPEEYVYFVTFYMVNGKRNVIVVATNQTEDFEYFVRTMTFQ